MKVEELEAEILRLTSKDQHYLFDKLLHVLDADEEPMLDPDRPQKDFRADRGPAVTDEKK